MIEKYKIDVPLQHIEKLIHISDIHIRLYKRHAEYISVFETLYDDLKSRSLNDTAIVVTGDIVHAKTDMSPEMVRVTSDFLKSLADIAPTIIIAGNHDLNLSNPNRLDALSPIVDNLNHKQLYYFQKSGIYQFADVEFGVHAIADNIEQWPCGFDLDASKPKIALYHGAVNLAQTDVGYNISTKITTDLFDGYDMVLLGDIHKTQLLQEYDVDNNKPEILYAGSLIQQNHGEALTGHGYVIWDVPNRKFDSHVEIKNSFGYHTIKIVDRKMPSTVGLPDNIRLRLLVADTVDATVVKKVQSTIRKKCNVVECTISKFVDVSSNETDSVESDVLDDINDVDHQNVSITNYIANTMPNVSDDVVERVLDINTKLNDRIGEDELPKNIDWKPIRLKFNNLFSYGENNLINFGDMSGLYGLFSPNATGKTSAFDAMCFALYDKTPRAFKGSHIMNTRKDTFTCELIIEIDGVTYSVERTGIRKKNGEVKVSVDFHRKDGDVLICLNGEDRRSTNAIIRSYVGTYEDFVLTTLSVQNQNSLFIDTGQSDRKDLLSQFIGLTIFDRLWTMAADDIKEVAGALKRFKLDDFTQDLADVQTKIELITAQYDDIQHKLVGYSIDSEACAKQIKSLYEQKIPISIKLDDTSEDLDNIYSEYESNLEIEQAKRDNVMESLLQKRSEYTKLKTQIEIKLDNTNMSKLKDVVDKCNLSRSKISSLESEIKLLNLELEHNKEKLQKLATHKYDPDCEYCMNNVFVLDARSTQHKYDSLLSTLDMKHSMIKDGIKYLESNREIEVLYADILDINTNIASLESEISSLVIQHTNIDSLVNTIINEMSSIENLKQQILDNSAAIESNKLLQNTIDSVERDKFDLDHQITLLRKQAGEYDKELTILRMNRDDMLASIEKAEELETTYEAYETYLSVMGRDGLPYQLISQVIPTIESEVNTILAQTVDFSISLDVDGKNINGKILYSDDRTWPMELASGMEKFISGLAIRVALMSVSNLPRSNFLVIDEGMGVLDSDNLSNMATLFNILKERFDFLILISHLDIVRDIADNLIEIRREDGYSYINVE